jgi:hypothetical protein
MLEPAQYNVAARQPVATLFGAPFWFDSLQKITQVRGAGST